MAYLCYGVQRVSAALCWSCSMSLEQWATTLGGLCSTERNLRVRHYLAHLCSTGCRCAATTTSAGAMSATAQRDELWAQIEASAYPLDNKLPVDDPSAITGLGLLIPPFLWQTFFHKGSTMPIGKAN